MKILIVTGGSVDTSWAKELVGELDFDFCIAADRGLYNADLLGIKVDLMLGDYDSVDETVLLKYKENTNMVVYPKEKDYTDTHIALIHALEKKPERIFIIGATGTRLDHTMTNLFLLKSCLDRRCECIIFDKNNKIYFKNSDFELLKDKQYGDYVSFLPVSETVILSLEGFKYRLDNYELKQGLSICQSNEILEDKAKVSVKNGVVAVFETRD